MNFKNQKTGSPDFLLFFLTVVLMVSGLIMIYSASAILAHDRYGSSYYFFLRQLLWILVGCAGMWVAYRVDLEALRALAIPGLFLGLFLMAAVCVPGIGRTVGGAQRWFRLGPFSFQPSEIMKIVLVFYLADSLDRRKRMLDNWQALIPYGVITLLWAALLQKQHDLGTLVLLGLVTLLLLIIAGMPYIFGLVPLAVSIPLIIYLVESASYRMKRISAFLNPWDDPQGAGF